MSATDEEWIANKFRKLGWLGVWIQIVLGILPLAMLCYILLGKVTGAEAAFGLIDYIPHRDGSPLHNWPSTMTEG